VPPEQSLGWTLWLMERASRCIWALDGGKKERRRCQKAMKPLSPMARQPHDVRLCTDGERRAGNRLFERGQALVKNGKPGRPKKTVQSGVHVRGKHNGAQAQKKGRKRPTSQSPWKAHPEPARTLEETEIPAHQAEAFWSALRRQCAPFRRQTHRYAKATKGLQRL
jgi:hypothetical protein